MLLSQQTEAVPDARAGMEFGASSVARPVAAASDISLTVIADLAVVAEEWKAFETSADCTAFQSFAWHAAWQKHVGDLTGVAPAIVVGKECDRILFILPLAIEHGRLASRLVWHGSDLCDYNAPLLAPEFAAAMAAPGAFAALWKGVVARLQADSRFRHDVIVLAKMPETVGAQANPFMALPTTLNPSGAYATPLTADWDSFYAAKRSSATRRSERTKLKRLAELGAVRFVSAEEPAEIGATLTRLVDQKSKQFARMGVEDIFLRPGYRDFFFEIASNPSAGGIVHVSRLDVGETVAAANLGLVFRNRYYHVLASYDLGPVSRFSPGVAHLHELMRFAILRKCVAFDFTIGDEGYKRGWSDTAILLHDHRRAASILGWAVLLPSAVLARTKRLIKQTPILWRMVQATRSLIARLTRRAGAAGSAPESGEPPSS
jgi:CelD/BcsL family acetyltransferase involved in cellulose biosynthesis